MSLRMANVFTEYRCFAANFALQGISFSFDYSTGKLITTVQ